jgi:Domain of unknown function (DUF4465)/Secretion system C-terminal sorting domain
MKKIYVLVTALVLGANVQAQQVETFESFTLAVDSFDNGSGGAGDFNFSPIWLNNIYDVAWDSWDGFAMSNVTDNTTAGWGNQYSAYPGSGSNGSNNYAVAYRIPQLNTTGYLKIDSLKITNATYAAISMRDGDAFAKQFGSPNDANGTPDGTNGEDFFKVWIIGESYSGDKDSIEFFLADYRFADNNLDYIVDEWVNIDLTSLSLETAHISFRFESSDNGAWGMNTPAYFALDDVRYELLEGLDELSEASINVFPNPMNDNIVIQGEEGLLTLSNVNGQVLMQTEHSFTTKLDVSALPSGVYIVSVITDKGLITERVIK